MRKLNVKYVALTLSLLSTVYWAYYAIDSKMKLDVGLYSTNKFESVKLNKHHDYQGVQGSWNIQHQYADYLDKATKYISREKGTSYFSNDAFASDLVNLDRSLYSQTKLNSSINDDFILGLQHTFKLKLSHDSSNQELSGIVGDYIILHGDVDHFGYVKAASNEYLEVVTSLPIGTNINSIEVPKIDGKEKKFKVLLDSERMGLVRGGLVNQFNDNKQRIYVRTFSFNDSKNLLNGSTIKINNKNFKINTVIPIGLGDFIIEISGQEKFIPYIDSRINIVDVTSNAQASQRAININISENIDNDFAFGIERHYQIKVDNNIELKNNANLIIGDSKYILKADDYNGKTIAIDLIGNVIDKLNVDDETKIKSKIESGHYSDLTANEYKVIKEKYKELYSSEKIDNLIPLRVWLKGADVNVYYEHNKQLKADKFYATVPITPDNDFKIWEIYPGSMLNLFYNKVNPAPTEMLIHVLGKTSRSEYYSAFNKISPEYVSFAKPERFTPWLLNWHWSFFKELVRHYKPVVDLDEFSLWEKQDKINKSTTYDFTEISKKLPTSEMLGSRDDKYSLYTVKLKYSVSNPYLNVPLIGKSPRFFMLTSSPVTTLPVSLPWSETEWEFPLVVKGESTIDFNVKKMSDFLDSASITIDSISLHKENVSQENIESLFLDYHSMR
ncbi:hypothetical protein [Photobacterium nomapromontoriensis]|uniref:hypothetical protein n=1 Tax=Photobacterium nomapromontoriensis TaxID=2910237 RepID=UPI003D0AB232